MFVMRLFYFNMTNTSIVKTKNNMEIQIFIKDTNWIMKTKRFIVKLFLIEYEGHFWILLNTSSFPHFLHFAIFLLFSIG